MTKPILKVEKMVNVVEKFISRVLLFCGKQISRLYIRHKIVRFILNLSLQEIIKRISRLTVYKECPKY
jgi:hypothetical protein